MVVLIVGFACAEVVLWTFAGLEGPEGSLATICAANGSPSTAAVTSLTWSPCGTMLAAVRLIHSGPECQVGCGCCWRWFAELCVCGTLGVLCPPRKCRAGATARPPRLSRASLSKAQGSIHPTQLRYNPEGPLHSHRLVSDYSTAPSSSSCCCGCAHPWIVALS